ncbi:MAG: hypothetical protein KF819_17670 [Labilithrix sp.]|nr:hypothetical protein [Labilithrix sp.]
MLARKILLGLFGLAAFAGCAVESDDAEPEAAEDEVRVDTRSPEARRQYDANVAFANAYAPRCGEPVAGRPRVLVTGFGRFMGIANNATGRVVSTLVPAARYPETVAPPRGQVDPPDAQLSVGTATIALPNAGEVDVCAMILPVYWDLAAILVAKEMDRFQPTFVMMNGVAGSRQDIWIELGATNKAAKYDDGSNQLRPAVSGNEPFARIIETAGRSEEARGNFLSWSSVASAARETIAEHANDMDRGTRFGDLMPGAKLAGFPRASNTYLCNNITYVTGYLMSHPHTTVRLLRASPAVRGAINEVKVRLERDFTRTPRVFVHWPSEMATMHHAAGAEVMKTILDAQLGALARGDAPTVGDNALADPALRGGSFF